MSNTWFKREEKRKVTFRMGESETEIDFALIKKEHRCLFQNVKTIRGKFQHVLLVEDIGMMKMRSVVIKTCSEREGLDC